MKNLFLLTLLIAVQVSSYAQMIGFDEIDPKKVSPWVVQSPEMYQYVYHFGDSEAESNLIIFFANGKVYAQISDGEWTQDATTWKLNYENLSNVKIEGNKFYSSKTNGEFVVYDNGSEKVMGLKVLKPWTEYQDKKVYEIGTKSFEIKTYFSGKFPQASYKLLTKEELAKMSKEDLKIMRNEIYARYGYKFAAGGEMEKYFATQDWYAAQHEKVDAFMTTLETANIKLIQEAEK